MQMKWRKLLMAFFWLAFLIRALARRKFMTAAGFAAAVVGATLVALVSDHASFEPYLQFLHRAAIEGECIPTVSGVFRLLFFRDHFRMQFVPMALGLLWSL